MLRSIVYVLGAAGSGTSAVRNAVAQVRSAVSGENYMGPVLIDLIESIRWHKRSGFGARLEGSGLSELNEEELIRCFFGRYEDFLSKNINSSLFIDEAPTVLPVKFAPDLAHYHSSDVYFIYCRRRHIDAVELKVKELGRDHFLDYCHEWARCASTWESTKARLGKRTLEVDFRDLVLEPARVATMTANLLSLDKDEAKIMARHLFGYWPEGSGKRDALQFLKFSELDWTGEERRQFLTICGPLGDVLGYGLEAHSVVPLPGVL